MAKNGKVVANERRKTKAASSAPGEAGSDRVSVLKTYKVYINGKFPRTESGRYYTFESPADGSHANICLCTRKDFREAIVAARAAQSGWASATAFLRGQILYRIAEMLEGRRDQFVHELQLQGATQKESHVEVDMAIDRLIHYAGWSDKYQQIFSSVNPVAAPYFNFTIPEPTGVVAIAAPEYSSLLGLISNIAPVIVGGNTCMVLASHSRPLSAVTFGEVLHSSDVPAGVVNILTGERSELLEHMASHMDVNAVIYCGKDKDEIKQIETLAASNMKRVFVRKNENFLSAEAQDPYYIIDTQEFKTTWHPIGT